MQEVGGVENEVPVQVFEEEQVRLFAQSETVNAGRPLYRTGEDWEEAGSK